MADKKQLEASKIDALYSWISYDLQKMKGELLKEMKYSSVQVGSLYQAVQSDKDKSAQAISQEIRYSYKQNQTIYDGISEMISGDIATRINGMDEKLNTIEELLSETKYTYAQQQAIYEGVATLITDEVLPKLEEVATRVETLEYVEKALADIITMIEDNDYKALVDSLTEKTEESVAAHTAQILDAVAAIPAENVDYNRIVDEVGDKVIELLSEVVSQEAEPAPVQPVDAKIDYDKLIYGTAEKVVESLPYPEKVDYRRINDSFERAAEKLQPAVGEDVIANAVTLAVEKAMAAIDIDAIATAVAAKIEIPVVEPEAIDYERLADMVADRIAAKNAEQVAEVVVDEEGAEKIASIVAERIQLPAATAEIDYERIASIVDEKLASDASEEEISYNLVLDDEGIAAVAQGVAAELCRSCAECVSCPTEETTEEVVEEAPQEVEEIVEEVVESEPETVEVVEEVIEEAPIEEVVEESIEEAQPEAVSEELAVASEPTEPTFDEVNDQLVDAETGLVIRLKKSFTAKMKQSDERVKGYYSDLKNELTSYKKINSNVSWHGDRFNFGRDTIAKVNICGKTLCFYVALDPEDPELKTTVYHQKNVGNQKAYENTPFMVKIKSDAAAKKALRLVGYLAEKLGAEKNANFENVDYVEEFAYASTKQLFDEGFIKMTKEKKVDLDF